MSVPLFDTATALQPLQDQLRRRIDAVLESGRYILGPEVEGFEREFADYLGVKHVIGVGNGTDALTIALRALGVGPGDQVLVPSFTFYATAEAIGPTGATPVFCDVDFDSRNVTVQTVEAALTPATKAIVAVDLFGNPSPAQALREAFGLPVVEDAAQAAGTSAHGCKAGCLGDVATFSFFPSKNLGCFGDGGAIATNDEQIAQIARMLRFHGSRDKSSFELVGFNSRLDAIQAAVLRVMLPHLDAWAKARRAAADAYTQAGLAELVKTPKAEPGVESAWHLYVVTHPEADRLEQALASAGVQARGYYRTPIHRQPAMARWAANVHLPVTDELAKSNLALPMSPTLSAEQAGEVVAAVANVLATAPSVPR